MFLQRLERAQLQPLPETRFEYAEWKTARVNIDYHVAIDRHYYSVPYQLSGQRLKARITASTAMGRGGIINIDREAQMSGALHTKGILILTGFLRTRFAQNKPLSLTASLTFEQNYGPIDGDSASSAEL